MAMIYKKRKDPSGCVIIEIGTNNTEVPHSERHRIITGWLNRPKAAGMSSLIRAHYAQITLGSTINEPDGPIAALNNARKQTIYGSGWYEITGNSSSVGTGYLGKTDCFILRIHKAAYDVLSANGQADILAAFPLNVAFDDGAFPLN